MQQPAILNVYFVNPIAHATSADPSLSYLTASDADMRIDGDFLAIEWRKTSEGRVVLVPLTNIKSMTTQALALPQPEPQPQPQPQPQATKGK